MMNSHTDGGRVPESAKSTRRAEAKRQEPPSNRRKPPRLLDRVQRTLRSRHYSRKTERSYCQLASDIYTSLVGDKRLPH